MTLQKFIYLTMIKHRHLSLIIIVLCLPIILWAVCGILPTFDDFTTLQSPWWVQIADPGYFFSDSMRRPFDALLGAVVGWWPTLFPTLNHVLIILGHTASAFLVFSLCQRLKLSTVATNIATLYFFFSPATLGATLACDGFNQTFAQLWGLLGMWTYLKQRGGWSWLLCVLMAVLSKENGLAWAVVPPIVALAFGMTTVRQSTRDVGKGLLLTVVYFIVLLILIHSGIEYPDEYAEATLKDHVKDLVQLLAYTWVPLDYMSAVYALTRNMTIVVVTALLSLPFLLLLASQWRLQLTRRLLLLVVCFFILALPHLVTVVSIMHNYAALSIAAIIIATLLSSTNSSSKFITLQYSLFSLFLAAALFTDSHHYLAARDSGLLGKRLAMQAIESAKTPPRSALVINIDDPTTPRYSSFCVRPVEAFAWGLTVRHYSGYVWKTAITEASFDHYNPAQVKAAADSALQTGNDVVWVVGHRSDSLTIFTPAK